MSQVDEFNEISARIMRLSMAAKQQGDEVHADRLVEVAADFELLSDDLQMCWGGPLNGQSGRRAIFEQILGIGFDTVLETGTYRGITTEWLAERFNGTVASCELEKIYFRQAQNRLANRSNVSLNLLDSRQFLEKYLEAAPASEKVFVYLDAHWKNDLPLAQELEIIDRTDLQVVIAIDDFRVPGDAGYAFDDYGPGKALTIELFEFLKNRGYRIYFPSLPSSLEDGAKRGVCVLSRSMTNELDGCNLLRGGDWRDWRIVELETFQQEAIQRLSLCGGHELPAADVVPQPFVAAEAAQVGEVDLIETGESEWLRIARRCLAELDLDQELVERMTPDVARLLSRHSDFERVLDQWARHFRQQAEDRKDRMSVGRALVEERAHVIQLARQIHQLRERLREKDMPSQTKRVETQLPRANLAVLARITRELKASRALRVMSHVAPLARRNVERLEEELKKFEVEN
jgi:predicted O-methyltransferase YrrM